MTGCGVNKEVNCDCFQVKNRCPCTCKEAYGPVDLRRVWRVGTSAEYFPFEEIDEDGNFYGFDIDVINKIAQRLNFNVEFVNMDFDSLLSALSLGYIDVVISGITDTPKRRELVDFTQTYIELAQVMLYHEDFPLNLLLPRDDSQFNYKIIGSQKDTIYTERLQEMWTGAPPAAPNLHIYEHVYLNTLAENLSSQETIVGFSSDYTPMNGPLFAVILVEQAALSLKDKYPKLLITPTEFLNEAETCSIALAKGNPLLPLIQSILDDLITSGFIEERKQFWFSE